MRGNVDKETFKISYGKNSKIISIPKTASPQVLAISDTPSLKNPEEFIRESLRNPCQSKPLKDLVNPGNKILIIIPDLTRPIPLKLIIPVYLEELLSAGIQFKDITLLIALGTHRPMTEAEIKESVGEEVFEKVNIINHDWDNDSKLVDMGMTELGTPIKVNRLVFESDFVIGIGSVKPHRTAGWSGGGKIIDPGVCGSDTIGMTHWRSAEFETSDMMGKADNPMRNEIEKVAEEAGLDFITNVVLNRHDEITFVSSGHFISAHRKCVEFAKKIYHVKILEKADILIAGTGSWATDFWAAAIVLFTAELLIKNNGTIVLFARCPDGIAPEHPEILKYGYLKYEDIKKLVNQGQLKDLAAASHIAVVSEVLLEKRINCILFSEGVSKEMASKLGLYWAKSSQDALKQAFKRFKNNNVRTYIISGDNIADNLMLPN